MPATAQFKGQVGDIEAWLGPERAFDRRLTVFIRLFGKSGAHVRADGRDQHATHIEFTVTVVAGYRVLLPAYSGPDDAILQVHRGQNRSPQFQHTERPSVQRPGSDGGQIGSAAHETHGCFEHIVIGVACPEAERIGYHAGQETFGEFAVQIDFECIRQIDEHLAGRGALRRDPIHVAKVRIGDVMIDHKQRDGGMDFRLIDFTHAVHTGRIQAYDQAVVAVDLFGRDDLICARKRGQVVRHTILQGNRILFAHALQHPAHAKQAADGIAVRAHVAHAEDVVLGTNGRNDGV